MSDAFRENAPLYWDRGLSVVPVEPGSKKPAPGIGSWSGFNNNLPTIKKRENWLERYGNHNIGLLTNMEILPGYSLGAVDVDRDDLVPVVQAILGDPPSGKRGKKGVTFFVKVHRGDNIKKSSLKDCAGAQAVDILVKTSMTVLPPSVHMETGLPYTWVGTPLLDCYWEELPTLEVTLFYVIQLVVAAEHTPTLLSGTSTHEAGLRLVAQLVRQNCPDALIARVITALLPADYRGTSLEELPGWIASAREKGFADAVDADDDEEEVLAAKVIRVIKGSGVELFSDGERGYGAVPAGTGVLTYGLRSSAFEQWVRNEFYAKAKRPLTRSTISDALATLEAEAVHTGPRRSVGIRIDGGKDHVEVDLGTDDGRVIRITAEGWKEEARGEHYFYRSPGFLALPLPARGSRLDVLKQLLNLDERTFHLITAYLINALKPTGPYLALLLEGEQGSGKSFASAVIKSLIDPNRAEKMRLPDNERDLMIQAKEFRLLIYDNASGMRSDMSDALATLATGGGIAVRRLYTDGELNVLTYTRPFLINGIRGFALRPDLLERAIPVRLSPMSKSARRTESELLEEFERLRPGILGALYDAVAQALANYEKVEPTIELRMADAARWIAAAEPALGVALGTLLRRISDAQEELFIERIEADDLVIAIRRILQEGGGVYEGFVGELHEKLMAGMDFKIARALPKTAQQLSTQLARLGQAMAKAGIVLTDLGRVRRGRRVRIVDSEPPDSVPKSPGEAKF